MLLGASPSLVVCFSLHNSLGCHGIPKLRLFLLLIPSSIVISTKTWKLQSHKTQQNLHEIVHILFLHYIYCIPIFYGKNPSKKTIESSKQAHNAKKTKSVKNRIVSRNLDISYFCNSKNSEKLGQRGKFVYKSCVKKSGLYRTSVKNENYFPWRKSFCFSARSNQLSP